MRKPMRLTRILALLSARHPIGVVVAAAGLAALSLWFTAGHLEFNTGRRDLVSEGERYRQLDEWYEREFEELPERVVVVIQAPHPEAARGFATALGERWAQDPMIAKVLYRIDPGELKRKGLFYLPADELIALERELESRRELLRDLADSPRLPALFALINGELTSTLVDFLFTRDLRDEPEDETSLDTAPLLALLRETNHWVHGARIYESPWETFFGGDADLSSHDGFLWSDDRRLLFVLANPEASAGDFNRFQGAIAKMRADVRELQRRFPGTEVGLTGRAVLETDEMATAKRDMTLASLVALGGVTLLFVVAFRGILRPGLAALTLIVGLSWALGFTTVTVGHLNILTISLLPMLIGLGIDYSVHVVARYEKERAAGYPVGPALERTLTGTGSGVLAAALTTALSFFTLWLAGFRGLVELGLLSGGGVLLATLAALTVLPALLRLTGAAGRTGTGPARGLQVEYLDWVRRHPRVVLGASGLLVAVSLLGLARVHTDFNLLRLQAEGTEGATWARRIFESTDRSALFEVVTARSLDEVRRKAAALEALPTVAAVESIASVLPEDQERKRPLVRRLAALAAGLSFEGAGTDPVDLGALRDVLGRIKAKLGSGDEAPDPEDRSAEERAEAGRLIQEILDATARMAPAEAGEALVAFETELFRDLDEKLALLAGNPEAEPVALADLPPELRERYVGRTGHYRLLVFPADDVWEFEPLARFVGEVTSVDPEAQGTPVTTFAYLRTIKEGYLRAGAAALVGVALLTFLVFRAWQPSALALVPLGVGGLWTLGAMGLLGVPFNPANLLLLPLLVGIGIGNGIYVVHRFREAGGEAAALLPRDTGRAITLSALTTLVGFGSLMLSSHRGIHSLGLVVVLGASSVLVASLLTLPGLLAVLSARARSSRAASPAAHIPEEALRSLPALGSARGADEPDWRGIAASAAERRRVAS